MSDLSHLSRAGLLVIVQELQRENEALIEQLAHARHTDRYPWVLTQDLQKTLDEALLEAIELEQRPTAIRHYVTRAIDEWLRKLRVEDLDRLLASQRKAKQEAPQTDPPKAP